MSLCEKLGKKPVGVNDSPGFVSNRVLMPMINEAAFAVMEGVATPEAVDAVMKLGMNHPMGPLELADLIGLDVCVDILDVLHSGFGDAKYAACPLLRQHVAAGGWGANRGRASTSIDSAGRSCVPWRHFARHLRWARHAVPLREEFWSLWRRWAIETPRKKVLSLFVRLVLACRPESKSGRVLGHSGRIGPPAAAGPKRKPSRGAK